MTHVGVVIDGMAKQVVVVPGLLTCEQQRLQHSISLLDFPSFRFSIVGNGEFATGGH